MGQPVLTIQMWGDTSPDNVREAGGHLKKLAEAVSESVGAEIDWTFGEAYWVCDGCERRRPEDHDGWVNDGIDDLCPYCAASRVTF